MKSTAVVGSFTLMSRILGFIRDMVIAYVFGASASVRADAFLIAFKIPNFMRRLFAEGAFSQAFIPILSEYKTQRSQEDVQQLANYVAGNLGGVLVLVTITGVLAAPLLVLLFAPGFIDHQEKYDLTVSMLQITFPYLLFIALTAFAGSLLNTYGKFAVPAFTPVLLNVALIIAALWGAPYFDEPVMALAWGVFIAGIVQLAFQFPFLYRLGLVPRPKINRHDEGVKRIHKLMLPALFGVSVSQINLLIDTLMASFLATGSVAWLYYSDRLMEFPVGVFGLALATVILPNLSKTVAQQDFDTYSRTLDWGLRWVFLIATPATIALMILSVPIMATLFHHGEFSEHDVLMSASSLVVYAIGLTGFVFIKVLASGFYSRQDTRTPVKIAVIAMITNMILNLLFIIPLQHVGLALATSLAALLNALLLFRGLRQQGMFQLQPGWKAFLTRIAIATLCMAGLLWWGIGANEQWLKMDIIERAIQLGVWITSGIGVYFGILFGLGVRLKDILLK